MTSLGLVLFETALLISCFPAQVQSKPADEELRQIKRELDRVKEERDILKKALAYFAEDQK